ncbi:5'/3'-nucleotidase SurE [Natronobacterium gregoryi]|uniref:5'-nucleotidase SurE n=2 Tax=Natronobacterium gregoryi TaxID=44930 RepID=L0ADI0_NATGS|nr:5'/3'-nucleotidase SurE [Natronobacterium gregoryi]AFZ71489.1 5'/3'-nucleotidase SurE [Natronobacterium gregoryi SP2]ELY66792.1 Multifunctional protein surE [Natronobacterium gregoryi SP2]PLK18694.1 5'/3'-nucleotidase SurE [Natronobacterium gregoryi SP2]SFJ68301.1 5'-nucleotidase /3'-nucleotidase /exopolyphosphatase [Natronobacterium gregoryi]
MSDSLEILLTNDDGIDSTGIRALYDALSERADVTVVAPANDQSACGRSISHEVDVYEHELGYALDGTPADCVVAGLSALTPETVPDLVVAGCNEGANLGEYVLGRSGTISAAVEAAFFDVPAIATSMYVPVGDISFQDVTLEADDFAEATRVTTFLAEHALEAGVFEHAAYLNVNVPIADGEPAPIEITRPSKRYEMDAERDGDRIRLKDRVWESMDPEAIPDPEGTDRRAVTEGRSSVSPLTAPHSTNHHELLAELVTQYHAKIGIGEPDS